MICCEYDMERPAAIAEVHLLPRIKLTIYSASAFFWAMSMVWRPWVFQKPDWDQKTTSLVTAAAGARKETR